MRHLVREHALNMLVRSNKRRALVGRGLLSEVVMNWSICVWVMWTAKSTPPLVWMPYWPCFVSIGSMWSEVAVSAMVAAVRLRPVPMPIGLNLSRWLMSLCRAKKWIEARYERMGGGIWLFRMSSNNVLREWK